MPSSNRASTSATVILGTYASALSVPVALRVLGADGLSLLIVVPALIASVCLTVLAVGGGAKAKAAVAEFLPWFP
jgi:hypothetical protein